MPCFSVPDEMEMPRKMQNTTLSLNSKADRGNQETWSYGGREEKEGAGMCMLRPKSVENSTRLIETGRP